MTTPADKTETTNDPTRAPINADVQPPPVLCTACGVIIHLVAGEHGPVFDEHPPPEGIDDRSCIGSGREPARVSAAVDAAADIIHNQEAETEAPEAVPFPRRRLMMSVQIAADNPGGVARCLLELINWIEAAERRAPGIDRDLGQQSHADGDRTRSFSAELDDQAQITHDTYEAALARWKEAQG